MDKDTIITSRPSPHCSAERIMNMLSIGVHVETLDVAELIERTRRVFLDNQPMDSEIFALVDELCHRAKGLESGLRELRRWVGDGDLSESFGWDDSCYTPAYREVLRATDALLKPNATDHPHPVQIETTTQSQ